MFKKLVMAVIALTATVAAAQTVDEIVARNVKARGGEKRLREVTSQKITAEIVFSPERKGQLQVEIKRPNRMRQELTLNGKTYIRVLNGDSGWALDLPDQKEPRPLSAEEIKNLSGPADLDGPLLDHKEKGSTVELIARELVRGRDAFRLRITQKDGATRTDYIDALTWLESKWEGTVMNDGKPVQMESYFNDFRKVHGVVLPFKIESGVPGAQQKQEILIQKIELNTVPDSRFRFNFIS